MDLKFKDLSPRFNRIFVKIQKGKKITYEDQMELRKLNSFQACIFTDIYDHFPELDKANTYHQMPDCTGCRELGSHTYITSIGTDILFMEPKERLQYHVNRFVREHLPNIKRHLKEVHHLK